jgi:hypothetical protein
LPLGALDEHQAEKEDHERGQKDNERSFPFAFSDERGKSEVGQSLSTPHYDGVDFK